MNIDGIEIIVVKKKIKNIYLRVEHDKTVKLSAPKYLSDKKIGEFVQTKLSWLKEKLSELENVPENRYEEGAKIYILGEEYTLHIVENAKNEVEIWDKNVTVRKSDNIKKSIDKMNGEILKKVIPEITFQGERLCGRRANSYKVRTMKSRWGSCNIKTENITLSSHLAKYPKSVILSVVVHEICHLYEASHNKRFHLLCDKFYPDTKNAEKILKSHCFD